MCILKTHADINRWKKYNFLFQSSRHVKIPFDHWGATGLRSGFQSGFEWLDLSYQRNVYLTVANDLGSHTGHKNYATLIK